MTSLTNDYNVAQDEKYLRKELKSYVIIWGQLNIKLYTTFSMVFGMPVGKYIRFNTFIPDSTVRIYIYSIIGLVKNS